MRKLQEEGDTSGSRPRSSTGKSCTCFCPGGMRGLSPAFDGFAPRFASAILASIIFTQFGIFHPSYIYTAYLCFHHRGPEDNEKSNQSHPAQRTPRAKSRRKTALLSHLRHSCVECCLCASVVKILTFAKSCHGNGANYPRSTAPRRS